MPYASKCPDRFKIAILDGELRITQYAATEINPDGADTLFEEFGTLRDADNQKAVLQQVEKLYNITNSTMEYADYNGSEILVLTL